MADRRSRPNPVERLSPRGEDPRPALSATLGPLVGQRGHGESAAEALERLRELSALGFRGVQWPATIEGLRPRDLDASARRGVRSELARAELRCTGIDLWVPPGHFLDPATIDRAVGAIEAAIGLAADLAADVSKDGQRPVVCTVLPSSGERRNAGALAASLADAIAGLVAQGERRGVAVADHALDAIPPLARGVDPVLAFAAGRDPVALVVAGGATLRSVRLADLGRSGLRGPIGEPGEARLDVEGLRAALDVVGCRDMPVADARQWRDPLGGLQRTIERWAGGPVAKSSTGRERL